MDSCHGRPKHLRGSDGQDRQLLCTKATSFFGLETPQAPVQPDCAPLIRPFYRHVILDSAASTSPGDLDLALPIGLANSRSTVP